MINKDKQIGADENMVLKGSKNDEGIIASIASSNLFPADKKTRDANEEIYHSVNFPDADKLLEQDEKAGRSQKKQ